MTAAPRLCPCSACAPRRERQRAIDAATVRAAFADIEKERVCSECNRVVYACRCEEE